MVALLVADVKPKLIIIVADIVEFIGEKTVVGSDQICALGSAHFARFMPCRPVPRHVFINDLDAELVNRPPSLATSTSARIVSDDRIHVNLPICSERLFHFKVVDPHILNATRGLVALVLASVEMFARVPPTPPVYLNIRHRINPVLAFVRIRTHFFRLEDKCAIYGQCQKMVFGFVVPVLGQFDLCPLADWPLDALGRLEIVMRLGRNGLYL